EQLQQVAAMRRVDDQRGPAVAAAGAERERQSAQRGEESASDSGSATHRRAFYGQPDCRPAGYASRSMGPVLADPTLLDTFRRWGYLEADLDPLGRLVPARVAELAVEGEEAVRLRE